MSPARPTTTVQTANRPLGERAVIFASPSATAVTTPLVSTVATPGLLLTHVIGTLPPLSTATVAARASLLPTVLSNRSVLFSVTLPTSEVTATAQRRA